MRAKKVAAKQESLLEAAASQWANAEQIHIPMMPTPLGSQPSPYIRAAWRDHPYGKTRSVKAASLHNGDEIFFRLEWNDPEKNDVLTDSAFPDGAAVLFPMRADAPILTMGDKDHPVNAWHWRADLGEHGRSNVARGVGTTVLSDKSRVTCRASWDKGVWRVVICRPLSIPDQAVESVQLRPGQDMRFGVAMWEGQNGERAGIKAFSPTWHPMTIEA